MSISRRVIQQVTEPVIGRLEACLNRQQAAGRNLMESSLVLQGRIAANLNRQLAPFENIHQAEFKVFSQFGEDGILQYLIAETGISRGEDLFVEFGVQDYSEANTRFLLMNNHWKGLIIDGSKAYMDSVRSQDLCWRHDLTVVDAWIDRDNINTLIGDAGFSGDIGVLSVDIDGNDYWVWERIAVVRPVIVVVEWNSVFGPEFAISVPYDPAFRREVAHHSNLFWGASIRAFEHLGARKGYSLVGSNAVGNNLFFVRTDRLGRIRRLDAGEAYVESRFRDSRDANGKLNFLGGPRRREEIADLEVIEVVGGGRTTLRRLAGR